MRQVSQLLRCWGDILQMVAPVRAYEVRGVIAAHITYLLDVPESSGAFTEEFVGRPRGGLVRLYPAGEKPNSLKASKRDSCQPYQLWFVWAALSASLIIRLRCQHQ